MIIKSLTLNNFRVFNGVNNINLAPNANNKPIVLFGGLNGAGKTSILTGVRVALYGRAAFGFNMTTTEYQQQLSALIHKGNGVQHNSASIELVFTYSQQGVESEYKIIRSWKKDQKDKLALYKNEVPESALGYEQCQAFLNELIPIGIADLFFFDGEKIADLAEDQSGAVLQTAVRRLLGIDVIERLKNDLNIFLKPHQSQSMPDKVKNEIAQLEKQRKAHEENYDTLVNKADEYIPQINGINDDIQKAQNDVMSLGGAWAKTKAQEEAKVKELQLSKANIEANIRKEMEGTLPLALAKSTLSNLLKQLDIESEIKQKQAFVNEFSKYKTQLIESLSGDESAKQSAESAIEQCLSNYQSKDNANNTETLLLDLSERERGQIDHQIEVASKKSYTEFEQLKSQLNGIEFALDGAAINIARAPDESRVADKLKEIEHLNDTKTKAVLARNNKLTDAKTAVEKAIELAKNIQKIHDKYKTATNVSDAVQNAQNTNSLLEKFAKELTEIRVKQLEAEFIKSYQKLARKNDLKISARINTTTFDVELIDEHSNTINRKELSAGEKQIYAIAILEALGKTSGRKLPIIIDTPLGRLDSHHRDKLIERYFPDASHQVIILSTDTEVDENYFTQGKFGDSISHAYEIQFNGETKASKLAEGYFWDQKANETISKAVNYVEAI
ncbi:DNA sulfur modification protein DndD [Colwellia sp. 1_MG-2023]|uniref:DNA sulfur modification protein DndD n=1 Tax=unclassified Colwellia TaxID=196834 RepID=UPI001C081456|nr:MULTISPECIES: DNA sulfur modification protein DndD [unclassified Colwellia]MBU2925803.1 DNA sulfur modification protein DndD [Colwellia sp. C2M11]MDO6650970.1 DNA sulfur modification protein DndD [Colwellia sp. 3_MG-2023]MDO6664005.1 DNA sulfur modification protein DndD [Colwellia sp. 2_MG-2023]MDO6688356.1 DNA sulfur modification protein DndD [Colwellia sp. 1_MG-2023]